MTFTGTQGPSNGTGRMSPLYELMASPVADSTNRDTVDLLTLSRQGSVRTACAARYPLQGVMSALVLLPQKV